MTNDDHIPGVPTDFESCEILGNVERRMHNLRKSIKYARVVDVVVNLLRRDCDHVTMHDCQR